MFVASMYRCRRGFSQTWQTWAEESIGSQCVYPAQLVIFQRPGLPCNAQICGSAIFSVIPGTIASGRKYNPKPPRVLQSIGAGVTGVNTFLLRWLSDPGTAGGGAGSTNNFWSSCPAGAVPWNHTSGELKRVQECEISGSPLLVVN